MEEWSLWRNWIVYLFHLFSFSLLNEENKTLFLKILRVWHWSFSMVPCAVEVHEMLLNVCCKEDTAPSVVSVRWQGAAPSAERGHSNDVWNGEIIKMHKLPARWPVSLLTETTPSSIPSAIISCTDSSLPHQPFFSEMLYRYLTFTDVFMCCTWGVLCKTHLKTCSQKGPCCEITSSATDSIKIKMLQAAWSCLYVWHLDVPHRFTAQI